MKKALIYGVLSSLFFAFTFIFNRSMHLSGGYWMWGSCLRYLFMLPMLALLLMRHPKELLLPVLRDIRRQPGVWLLWSTVGFGLFYLPLSLASVFGASWLVAASWQITIAAGIFLTPLFGKPIPVRNLLMSFVILIGILLLQIPNLTSGQSQGSLIFLLPLLIAAFSYPLGNRKMMQHCPVFLNTVQRVFGMTLSSMPFWLITAAAAFLRSGLPSRGQLLQSFAVALFSGVIATILFFHATDLVKENPRQLAVIEATQCGEVIFTLIGGILVLGDRIPEPLGFAGLLLIIGGMILNSFL